MKNKLVAILSKLKSTGFFYIFSSQILVKIVSFCGAMLIVRILSKDDYGLYSYTTNILSIFLLLDGLGTASAALQFSSEYFMDHEKKYAYMKYAFLTGFLFNIIVCCFIAISSQIISFKILGAGQVLLLMSLQPLVSYFLATIQTFLRTEIKNKEYSIFNTIQSVLTIIATIGGAYWKGVNGVVICNYVAFLIIAAYGLYVSRDYLQIYKNKTHLKNLEKKDLMKYAVVSSFNNAISSLLYTIDIFVIGIFFPDTAIIASYKTATLIPFALNFIPSAIVVYIYPYFARNNQNHHWIKVKYLKLIKYFGIFNLIISIALFVCAPLIIKIVFGEQYMDALVPFRILSIGYFIAATFRIPSGNVISMLHKVKFNMYVAIGSGICNIILNIPFIMFFGPVGASIATILIFIFTAIANSIYLFKILSD